MKQDTFYALSELPEGGKARVRALRLEGGIRRRLQDLGLVEGTQVECIQRAPSGDPAAYLIRGAVIALREKDASQIEMGAGA